MDSGTAKWIHSEADIRAPNGIHVDHIGQIGNVSIQVVVPVGCGSAKSFLERNPFQIQKPILEKLVCLRLNPVGDGGFRRPPVWRIVLEAAVTRRIVGWGNNNAVTESGLAP